MGRPAGVALYVVTLVAVVVGVDVLFFRHHFWPRLIANIGIVLVFAAFYLRFLKRPLRAGIRHTQVRGPHLRRSRECSIATSTNTNTVTGTRST